MLLQTLLPTTLCLTAAALVLNFWLGLRISQLRHSLKVSVGDGGHDAIIRRMRAQANFIENAPLTLLMFALVEASGKGGAWLAPLGAVFLIGRVLHPLGMEENSRLRAGRSVGVLTAMLVQLVLVVNGVLIATGRM